MAKNKKTLNRKALRQKRQAKRKQQRFLRIGLVAAGIILLAGYFLWPRPQAQAVSQERIRLLVRSMRR